MKRQFPLSLPPRGNPAWLPALLVPMLLLVAVAQLFFPGDVTLPPAGAVGRGLRPAMARDLGSVGTPPELVHRNLFAPELMSDRAQGPSDLLGGAVFAGTVQLGSRRVAAVQTPQGRLRYLAPGDEIAGWRLVALLPEGVRLARGATFVTVNYGQHTALATDASPQSQSEDQQ